ncbi:hypothetical protein APHAL10511_005349 [Amanita phalloides]|nr:hypothetical protein APHAL10511_005349 [Amanita phalloides]
MRWTLVRHAPRNALGVQLLSPALHAQIFPPQTPASFPTPPPPAFIQISRDHLAAHGLDPSRASSLPTISFPLPPLQGPDLSHHFHRIGLFASHPYRLLALSLASAPLPPVPDHSEWNLTQPGWTVYHYKAGGASFSEPVSFPAEDALVFDVETMPKEGHPYPVLAIAASESAWYAWISPWLLGLSEDPAHLIPFGPQRRLVVGHNVSFDRARVKDEYALSGTRTRWLDTMALHVAVNGISSHQRPAWNKWKKKKETERVQRDEAVEALRELIGKVREEEGNADGERLEYLRKVRTDMEHSLAPEMDWGTNEEEEGDEDVKRWESLTSANSLVDVARLHCGIDLHDKTGIRNKLVNLTRSDLATPTDSDSLTLPDLLSYCATDVRTTHQVFATVLPSFLTRCPHPVSFAGVLTMGSSFLPVNAAWERYIEKAESVYRGMEEVVRRRLVALAEEAMAAGEGESYTEKKDGDPWLSQLDWTPKKASKSRGIVEPEPEPEPERDPAWLTTLLASPLSTSSLSRTLPLLLKLRYNSHPLTYSSTHGWHYRDHKGEIGQLRTSRGQKTVQVLGPRHAKVLLASGEMTAEETELALCLATRGQNAEEAVRRLARRVADEAKKDPRVVTEDPWYAQLDWRSKVNKKNKNKNKVKPTPVYWPKWYWDLTKPKKGVAPGTIDITPRNRIAPLLLRLAWRGCPLYHSREHGWTYRVSSTPSSSSSSSPLVFTHPADSELADLCLHHGFSFHKLPHKDGEKANVGSPLSRSFVKPAADGTLTSPGGEAKEALELNAVCSYWMSSRDRIMNQMVVWEGQGQGQGQEGEKLGFEGMIDPEGGGGDNAKWGMILPQVITMGTVTRRAIEKTWLTASNAKRNRVGSELKAMVRAPPGYAMVGADVDSEELWISSCMGDAQFGMHGATALGWMTLEGTKAAGTDLHSKTATILGLSRDEAKVFNYSRIYGAGMRHAVLLLMQASGGGKMTVLEAQKLAESLYASTKGRNTHRTDMFDRKFWFGGSESYVFNKLEEIANSDRPRTPALGCGVTYALSREYLPTAFGADYMPSRINWVVQSSGVDYLHMLVVAMEYLMTRYAIRGRYLLSVHDELRYLVREEDRYRAALALQVANLWTRAMFAHRLGMDDLPQSVAFFSAVDVDRCLRKEVDMECVTPSQPVPIPPGERLGIEEVLERTGEQGLGEVGEVGVGVDDGAGAGAGVEGWVGSLEGYEEGECMVHRAASAAFLRAQAAQDFGEVKGLAQRVHGVKFEGGIGAGARKKEKEKARKRSRLAPVGDGEGYDWSDAVEKLLML